MDGEAWQDGVEVGAGLHRQREHFQHGGEVYARLNDSEWSEHVQQIYTANVDSTVAARLASLGTIDLEAAALRFAQAA